MEHAGGGRSSSGDERQKVTHVAMGGSSRHTSEVHLPATSWEAPHRMHCMRDTELAGMASPRRACGQSAGGLLSWHRWHPKNAPQHGAWTRHARA